MGTLIQGETTIALASRNDVGRSPTCTLRLHGRRVSSLHARVIWSGAAWLLRDLGSTNGTFIDGMRLPPGIDRPLQPGNQVAFGNPVAVWVVGDTDPPNAMAVCEETAETVTAQGGLLTLPPGDEQPEVSVYESEGSWFVETPAERRPARDRDEIEVGGARWRLHLPMSAALTPLSEVDGDVSVAVAFRVGADGGSTRLVVVGPNGQQEIPARASHSVLLTLARARVSDRASGIDATRAGWREVSELCGELDVDEGRLNVDIHRLRRQLADYGVPATIIERRPGERSLRIGCSRLVIQPV